MKPKEKVWLIIEAILADKTTDAEIIAHSGNRLTTADLDRFYKPAENVIDKAITKPEEKPRGKFITEACRSWLDYFEWPDR